MYLKRLEIQGFKSFASRTVLDFLPPKNGRFSITAVVGPNGSGKSNVVDAIRWVMGEQSLKSLRGKKSEDVIFNGSEAKGALGVCETVMVLDNSDNRAELDYPEIVITRRLYRSGESEYLINNNPVRLLDVHLLLAKAQFGQHSYSLIGQGTIDRMLTVTPLERKEFLDEAAGIKEFQIKQHQAQLKLARTKENMNQVDVLLKEIEPRLKMLAKQVRKLEQRQNVELALREAQEKYYSSLYWQNRRETEKIEQRLKTVDESYRLNFKELENIQNELSQWARQATRAEVFAELQTKHQNAVRVKNDWERQLAILQGKQQTAYSEMGKQNIGWLEKKISELKNIAGALQTELDGLEKEAERVDNVILTAREKLENAQAEKTHASVRLSQLQTKSFEQLSEKQYLELSGLTAVRTVLENKNRLGKVYGLVAELGEVEPAYRLAMEVAAGQHIASLVVGDEGVARAAIEFLRVQKMGVATFLPLNKISGRPITADIENILKEEGVLGLAFDLIKFDEKYKDIFSFVFGDTLIVKDLGVAQRVGIGRARMVTLEGDVAERRGVMKGGYRKEKRFSLSFSGRNIFSERAEQDFREEIFRAQEDAGAADRQLEKLKNDLLGWQMEKQTGLAKIEAARAKQKAGVQELSELQRELDFLQMSPEQYTAHFSGLDKEKQLILKEMEKSDEEVSARAQELELFNQKEEEKKQKVFALQEAMQKKQLTVNTIIDERNNLKIELARLETKTEDLNKEISSEMSVSLETLGQRQAEVLPAELLQNSANEIQKLKYQLSLIGGIDEEVTKEYGTVKEKDDFLQSQLKDLRQAVSDLEILVEELDEIMKKKRAASFKKIRKEFDRYFKVLFGGGNAELEEIYGEQKTEEELLQEAAAISLPTAVAPVLEIEQKKGKAEQVLTGIDVLVNPPGKKIKHINALSGGERTLTSLALICAILNCNPSPFVVMDEVEAALDETNTLRFANIMAELAAQSQFIVITHNRVTMHSADALYGVTMGGDGVSKLLSVKLEEAQKTAYTATVDKT